MGFFSFFHTPKPKGFQFLPRYYDPIKEDLEFRVQKIKNENKSEEGPRSERISAGFRRRQESSKKTSAIQLVLLLFFILFITLYWFFGNQGIIYLLVPTAAIWIFWRFRRRARK